MNASVRTRRASLSLWEASVEQTLSLCNASALKRRQTLWEYADVTPAVAHSQTRCPLIDSWMIREPTTLMHAEGHLAPMTAAACPRGRTERRHPSICVTSLLILCSWTLHHPVLHAETKDWRSVTSCSEKRGMTLSSEKCLLTVQTWMWITFSPFVVLENCWYSENIQFALCSGRTLKYVFLRM